MKRFVSLLAAASLVAGTAAMGFAAPKVTTVGEGVFVSSIAYTSGDNYDVGSALGDVYEDFSPGETVNIYLDPTKFTGSELDFTPANGMSTKELANAGVELRVGEGKNSNLIQNVSFKDQGINDKNVAYIQVKLTDNFTSTSSRDFETTIYIYADKKRTQSIKVGGTLSNSSVEVSSSDKYIFLSPGEVLEATDSISEIEVELSNDISIFTKMYKGKQYYASSSIDPSNADIDLMNQHPDIEMVYHLSSAGFEAAASKVKFNISDKLYVYDGAGNYLGTTDSGERLAFADTYYLASKEVSFQANSSSSDGDSSVDEPLPPIDGDSDIDEPSSSGGSDSDIPDTGVKPTVGLAAIAGVLALAVIGGIALTSRKK